jgi:patatin-like phospholipase/acyl hydrolase
MSKSFKVLSIDGGGIRGIFPAIILNNIEQKFNIKLSECFDLIAGTSTGSIIAAAIACDIPLQEVIDLYKNEGDTIFEKRIGGFLGLFKSRYDNKTLKKFLDNRFKDRTLSDPCLKTRLLIPTTDISNGDVHVIKSKYLEEFTRDPDRLIKDAILASCSAPLYFNPTKLDNFLLADGGLWANNPSLVALTEAIGKIKKTREIESISFENTKLLSIGTGFGHKYYDLSNYKSDYWGFLSKWEKSKLIDTILNLQSINTNNVVNFMLPKDNLLRLNFESDNELSLDSVEIIPMLESKAAKIFTENSKNIKRLLDL